MPRKTVSLVVGETYHVFNRGVDKRQIFLDRADYYRFHTSLQIFNAVEQSGSIFELRHKNDWIQNQEPLVLIRAYCLLGNHYHLVLTQVAENGISEFMKRVGGGYTSYFNERNERSGALFQGTYKRVHCENDAQLQYVLAYVNCNNIVHGRKEFYLSSLDAYTNKRTETFVDTSLLPEQQRGMQYETEARAVATSIVQKRAVDALFDRDTFLE